MSSALPSTVAELGAIESVLIKGDLSVLSEAQRVAYYKRVCETLGLNPLTQPFSYLRLSGSLTLYAKRDATEQLRKIHGVSILSLEKETIEGVYIVTAKAQDKTGRTDVSTGAVMIANLKGEALANALMKTETKAKRRVTLSICGLGMLDETEVETIPNAYTVEPLLPTTVNGSPAEPKPQHGGVFLMRVDVTDTANQNVKRYLVTDSNGEQYLTIKEKLGELCIQLAQQEPPVEVRVEWKESRYGHDITAVNRLDMSEGKPSEPQTLAGTLQRALQTRPPRDTIIEPGDTPYGNAFERAKATYGIKGERDRPTREPGDEEGVF